MRGSTLPVQGQRGAALVMALLVLFVVSLLAATLVASLQVDARITGTQMRTAQALNTAEAGVAEAMSRIRSGDIPNNLNPRLVAQIFLAVPGSVPVLGGDSLGLATGQAAGAWLPYTTANKHADALTVEYKTDAAKTFIYKYDTGKNPPIQTLSGLPIFVIKATGNKGDSKRRVVTEVIQKPFFATVYGAMAADQGVDFSGDCRLCGYNHSADTPTLTPAVHGAGCEAWGLGSDDLPASYSTGTVTSGGGAQQAGWPIPNNASQVGFYAGPWDALDMSQAEFYSWVGAPVATEPGNPKGVFYVDNDGTYQNATGNYAYHGGNGEGLLYVDGDITLNGNFTFRGLVYVEGDLKINGTIWILGALIVKGKTRIKIANGTCEVLYSRDAIAQNIAKYGGQFVTLSWRERP